MSANLSRHIRFVKTAARGTRGAVAAKNQKAADVGARVLSEGGNAVDAAICAALSLATLEPWTSGLGSAGCMTIWDQFKRRGHVIDFPAGLAESPTVAAATLVEEGVPRVRNPQADAHAAIGVPGLPDGLWAAHTFGTKPWPVLVGPAIELSEEGLELDWYAFLVINLAAAGLSRFARARELFFPGDPHTPRLNANSHETVRNPALTKVLRLLAERGARDFYEGFIAHAIIDDLQRGGSPLAKSDFRGYRARILEPMSVNRAGKRYLLPPDGPLSELFRSIMELEAASQVEERSLAAVNFAHTLTAAHAELHLTPDTDRWSSHLVVIDSQGNMASLSQSLGSLFGSKIVLPSTGILANNYAAAGQTRPSSEGQRKLAEHYLLPVLGLSGDRAWLAIGVSGDQHILPTLSQLLLLVGDYGYSLEDAFHQPRMSVSKSGRILIDVNASADVKSALQQVFGAVEVPLTPNPLSRPCAVAAVVDPYTGEHVAITETTELWAGAAAVQ